MIHLGRHRLDGEDSRRRQAIDGRFGPIGSTVEIVEADERPTCGLSALGSTFELADADVRPQSILAAIGSTVVLADADRRPTVGLDAFGSTAAAADADGRIAALLGRRRFDG